MNLGIPYLSPEIKINSELIVEDGGMKHEMIVDCCHSE